MTSRSAYTRRLTVRLAKVAGTLIVVAFEADQAVRRDTFGLLHEAIEGRRHSHQGRALLRPDFGQRAIWLFRMRDRLP